MIFKAVLLFLCVHSAFGDNIPVPCPPRYRQSIQSLGCSTGLLASTTFSECLPIAQCDDSVKLLALGAEHWEQSYNDVFVCCPVDVEDRVESPQDEEDCTMKCMLEHGIESVPKWTDGSCACSLTAFAQCDPFGEMAQGYDTCDKYFNHFSDYNCNYNLQAHHVCANEDFNNDGTYVQIRDLCPEQCASVEYEEDALDETVSFDLEGTGETHPTPGRRQLARESYRVNGAYFHTVYEPIGAYVYEHYNGQGRAWHARTHGCCSRDWWWSRGCSNRCRTSGHHELRNELNNIISSISVGPGCQLDLYQHGTGIQVLWSAYSPYNNRHGQGMMHMNVHRNDDASSINLFCDW